MRKKNKDKQLILSNRLYVPKHLVKNSMLREYTYQLEENDACEGCVSYDCDNCPAALGSVIEMFKEHDEYYSFSRGDLGKLYRLFGHFNILDDRSVIPLECGLKWNKEMKLRKHQKKAVNKWMDFQYGQIKAPARSGKCCVGNTLIFTEQGIIPIKFKDQTKGLNKKKIKVLSRNGKAITSYIYKEKVNKTCKIITNKGFDIEGTLEHPVQILKPNLVISWKRLDEICEGDIICINRSKSLWSKKNYKIHFDIPKLSIHATSIIHYDLPTKMSNRLGRLLGYLVANGTLSLKRYNKFYFTTGNKIIQNDFIKIIKTLFGIELNFSSQEGRVDNTIINSKEIILFLESLGLKFVKAKNKEIPFSILQSKKNIITSFLSAYFSCDSYIPEDRGIELSTASQRLAKQLQIVLTNYGIISTKGFKFAQALNSKSPKLRKYWSIGISGVFRKTFLDTFTIKKDIKKYKYRYDNRKVPYAKTILEKVKAKYAVSKNCGGWYKINGNKRQLKFFSSDKYYFTNRSKDISYELLENIELNTLKLMNKKIYKRVKKILKRKFFFDPVKRVKTKNKKKWVYDLTVPKGHNFITNGIVSHNTVIAVNLITRIQQKTLILTHLDELLTQFEETFYKFTNLLELEKNLGVEILGYPTTPRDFEQYEICLMTYQTFLSKGGKKKLQNYRDYFGLVVTDEVHRSSARGFAGVVGKFNAAIRLGLTATPHRKDEMHVIHENVVGPVVVKTKGKTLSCTVRWIRTGYKLPKFNAWQSMISKMISNVERNRLIIKYIIKDVKQGRSILVVTNRVAHCKALAKAIERYGINAEALWGSAPNRDEILDKCRSGETKVLVAMRQIVQVGIDVPIWSCYHCTIPMANEENFYQEMSRIRTPMEGKKKPLIRYYLDNHSAMYACKRIAEKVMKKEGFL